MRRVGDRLSIRLRVDWQGGFSGTPHSTVVVWETRRRGHIKAQIIQDTAPTPVFNKQRLDELFRADLDAGLRAELGE